VDPDPGAGAVFTPLFRIRDIVFPARILNTYF
jgi:hypothetical protein